jgi:hypothetical protein
MSCRIIIYHARVTDTSQTAMRFKRNQIKPRICITAMTTCSILYTHPPQKQHLDHPHHIQTGLGQWVCPVEIWISKHTMLRKACNEMGSTTRLPPRIINRHLGQIRPTRTFGTVSQKPFLFVSSLVDNDPLLKPPNVGQQAKDICAFEPSPPCGHRVNDCQVLVVN